MGSGAFAVEAVRQLAELYLRRKEQERDEQIPATDRTIELQKAKAYIALHNVYGVDLNATAVELAEISLWLDTMTAELKAPWFGLHLRRGNSLIGASRATYSTVNLKNHKWLDMVPKRHPIADLAAAMDQLNQDPRTAGRIHHFLLPSKTWGSAADAKDLKSYAAEQQKLLKNWRNGIRRSPTTPQTKALSMLGYRVEILWQFALQRLRIAEEQSRRTITLWGTDRTASTPVVKRAQIEQELFANPDSPYNRLRLVMDAWCALSFWPVTEAATAPLFDAWLAALQDILGMHSKAYINAQTLASVTDWDDLTDVEVQDLQFAGALPINKCLEKHAWLKTAQEIAAEQGFFHWDLDFAAVFAKGGFDLQIGTHRGCGHVPTLTHYWQKPIHGLS